MANEDRWAEADLALNALTLSAILQMPVARALAHAKHLITAEGAKEISRSVSKAMGAALEEGVVIRISFDHVSEVIFAAELLDAVLAEMKPDSGLRLKEIKHERTQFELQNGSAIFLAAK